MLKGLGDGDAVRSYQSTEPFYKEGDYSACQRLLILEELESGLGEWEYGAEILFCLEACWLCSRMSAQTDACMIGGGPDAYALCKYSATYIDENIPQLPPVQQLI